MTLRRSESAWIPVTMPRRRFTVPDIAPVLAGVAAALGVLASIGALLSSGVAGIDIFEVGNLERLATSTVVAAIGWVFAAFFCGGWAYGALRGREKRDSFADARGGHDGRGPVRWAGAGTGRSTNMDDSASLHWEGRYDEFVGRVR